MTLVIQILTRDRNTDVVGCVGIQTSHYGKLNLQWQTIYKQTIEKQYIFASTQNDHIQLQKLMITKTLTV